METNSLTQILHNAYLQVSRAQALLAESLANTNAKNPPDPAALRAQTQMVTQLTHQLLKLEQTVHSPAMQHAAIMPFLQWMGTQDAEQATRVSDAYLAWLKTPQNA